MLDLEELHEENKYFEEMRKSKQIEQLKFMAKIRSEFNPIASVRTINTKQEVRKDISGEQKIENFMNKRNFDNIWQFEIVGTKFE